MSIQGVEVGNFKGVESHTVIPIKPLTILFGANSSGKSTCLHALAALAQTLRLPNTTAPLILDDEFAYVHLGRFIDASHTKSYQDPITLGLTIDNVEYVSELDVHMQTAPKGMLRAKYDFKCTQRTQEIRLETGCVSIGSDEYKIERALKEEGLRISRNGAVAVPYRRRSGFLLEPEYLRATATFLRGPEHLSFTIAQDRIRTEALRTLYLGPFRIAPLRRYATRGAVPNEVGALGEMTATLLANEVIRSRTRPHLGRIAVWMERLGLGKEIGVARIGKSDVFDMNVTLRDGARLPLADLGYGVSQVLPVLAQCSFAPRQSTLLFEQPELHLHPIAARRLMSVFVDTMKLSECSIIVETHSPELVRECQRLMRAGRLGRANVAVYSVERRGGASRIREIEFDEDYDVYERWGLGVSDE